MEKFVPVVVIKEMSETDKILSALRDYGINCAEITFRTACAAEAIAYACKNYPTCTFTKQKVTETGVDCPKCGSRVLARHGKGRMLFYSCEKYPECDFSTWDMPLKEKCPDCGGMLYYRKSRKNVICKEKNCGYKRDEEMTVIE